VKIGLLRLDRITKERLMHSMPYVAPESLTAAFALVPDPRRQASIRYPLPAVLALAVSAILSGHHSVLAIAEWGARQSADVLTRLGFPDGHTPWQSTLHRLFARLDIDAIARMLTDHFTTQPETTSTAPTGISLDGKALRGQLQYRATGCPVDLLTAVCHASGMVLAHEPIEADGVTKAEAELTVAPALIAQLDWRGRVVTGDALFCQRHLCRQVLDAGGHYLLLVKRNQPTLQRDLQWLFDPPAGMEPRLPLLDQRDVQTLERGHGRQQERRHLIASTDLVGYSDWPGLAQGFRLERLWRQHGIEKRQVTYGITSLGLDVGTPDRLLTLKRGHWGIENGLHRVKDVTFGEDASLIHTGSGPLVMALLRDTVVSLLYRAGIRRVASGLRRFSQQPHAAVDLVVLVPTTHA
jgi:predicted transposase YbfD/YdcC